MTGSASFRRPAVRHRVRRASHVNDAPSRSSALLNHHPNGLLLFRDELSGWLHTMDRPGHENDRALRSIVRRGIRSVM